jgi:hypothetical protein
MRTGLEITLIIILMNVLYSCKTQKLNSPNMEKYDFETMNNSKVDPLAIKRNGWTIVMEKMSYTGATYYEYPPHHQFYTVIKQFHPNGVLKAIGKRAGRYISIGKWYFYDENGQLTEAVDEDKKFGKITMDWLLKFIEKEGHINLSTGEGLEYAIIDTDGRGVIDHGRFTLWLEEEKSFWIITVDPAPWNNSYRTVYHIEKDTGEVLFKKSEHVIMTR